MKSGVPVVVADSVREQRNGLAGIAALAFDQAEQVQDIVIVRLKPQDFPVQRFGLRQISRLVQGKRFAHQRIGVRFQRLLVLRFDLNEFRFSRGSRSRFFATRPAQPHRFRLRQRLLCFRGIGLHHLQPGV